MHKSLASLALLAPLAAALPQSSPCFVDSLTPSAQAGGDRHGAAVGLHQRTAFVGAPGDSALGIGAGAVNVFRKSVTQWVPLVTLRASDGAASDQFGSAVALFGHVAFVGAPGDDDGAADAGSVYVYSLVSGTWQETGKIGSSTPVAGAGFGGALALDGNRLVVGAKHDDGVQPSSGAAYVFELSGGTWLQTAKLIASDGSTGDWFGNAVDLSGDSLVVGAPRFAPAGLFYRGMAYAYDFTAGTWSETRLQPNPFDPQPGYGNGVAISGDRIVINFFRNISHVPSGGFFAWTRLGGAWSQTYFSEGAFFADQSFGTSMALEDDLLAVGVPAIKTIQTFRESGNSWSADETFFVDSGAGSGIGIALAISEGEVLTGAPRSNVSGATGQAYSWLAGSRCPDTICVSNALGNACPCANASTIGGMGCNNSTGLGGRLSHTGGQTQVSQDNLVFSMSRLPANQFGVLFMGDEQPPASFGDGARCVGGPATLRLTPIQAGASGEGSVGPGLLSIATFVQPGDVRAVQFWYRDPAGPCGTAFNLTNGLVMQFTP